MRLAATALLVAVLAMLALAATPSGGQAKVVVTQATNYYPVQGRSGLDLSREMLRGGKQSISLRHAVAATAARYKVEGGRVAVQDGKCVVRDVTVRLELTYFYPNWSSRGQTSGSVRRAWRAFYTELVRHEETHGQIARQGAELMKSELLKLSSDARFRCFNFRQRANQVFNRVTRQIKQRQLAFDRKEGRPSSKISKLQVALMKAE